MNIAEENMNETGSSELKSLERIEYFRFEEDFVEANVRCIPMIVRFKLDITGIKLKLSEWSKFSIEERIALATWSTGNENELTNYHRYITGLIRSHTAHEATTLEIDPNPTWAVLHTVPAEIQEQAGSYGWSITPSQWKLLTNLQRFALSKLSKPGHENKNFPKAMKEFGLISRNGA